MLANPSLKRKRYSPGQMFAIREDATADRCVVEVLDRGIALIFERINGRVLKTGQEREHDGALRVSDAIFRHAYTIAVRELHKQRKEESKPVDITVLEGDVTFCRLLYRDQIFMFGCNAVVPLDAEIPTFVPPVHDDFETRHGHPRQAPLPRLKNYERDALRRKAIGVIRLRRRREGYDNEGYGALRPFSERIKQLKLDLA